MAAQKGLRKRRKKADPFAGDKINQIDYKDVALLKKYITERGKDPSSSCNRGFCKGSKKADAFY